MKRFIAIALTASLGLFAGTAIAATTVSDYTAGKAANGIGFSRHNLGSLGEHVTASETSEICIFCHTPHHSNESATPLWNRSTANSTAYTAYGTTIAGTYTADNEIAPSSLACLSCHDGVTTFDNLVNRPGKDTKPINTSGTVLWTFTEKPAGVLTGRLQIGTALSNDHPISLDYLGGQVASLRDADTDIASIDLTTDVGQFAVGNPALAVMGQNRWAVKGFISTDASIQDLLRNGKVECASCHDPHFSNKSWDEVESTWDPGITDPDYPNSTVDGDHDSDGLFLRRVGGNTGSGVCRTCHNK